MKKEYLIPTLDFVAETYSVILASGDQFKEDPWETLK